MKPFVVRSGLVLRPFVLTLSLTLMQGALASTAPDATNVPVQSQQPKSIEPSTPWWEEDVWADPHRPFLYYGREEAAQKAEEERQARERIRREARAKAKLDEETPIEAKLAQKSPDHQKPKEDPFDFSRFTTVEALKEERQKRLNVAIMNPTIENMASYQAINAHVLALSARFAQAWQLGRLMNPTFDFTTTHPSANFATAALTDVKREETAARLKSLNGQAGLIFIGKPGDPLTEIAAGPVRAFARTWHLPLMATAIDVSLKDKTPGQTLKGFEGFDEVLPDGGRAALWGIKTFPAVVLVPTPEAVAKRPDFALLKGALAGRNGMLVAAGAVSGEELSRRITFLLKNSDLLSAVNAGLPGQVTDMTLPQASTMKSLPMK